MEKTQFPVDNLEIEITESVVMSRTEDNLEKLNKELYANTAIQFSFKESVEPIYRSLIDLLLAEKQPTKSNVKKSIEIFEKLKIAELKNFFGDGCLVSKSAEEINNLAIDYLNSPLIQI